jgi:hypothetical protein
LRPSLDVQSRLGCLKLDRDLRPYPALHLKTFRRRLTVDDILIYPYA